MDIAVGGIACLVVIFTIILGKTRRSSANKNEIVNSLAPEDASNAYLPLTINKAYKWLPPAEKGSSQGEGISEAPTATLTQNQAYEWLASAEENAPAQSVVRESSGEPGKDGGREEIIKEVAPEESSDIATTIASINETKQSIGANANEKKKRQELPCSKQ